MPKIILTRKVMLERRAKIMVELSKEFTDQEIGEMFNMDRTWVYRIRKAYEKKSK